MPKITKYPVPITAEWRREAAASRVVQRFKAEQDAKMIDRLTEEFVTAYEAIYLGYDASPQEKQLARLFVNAALGAMQSIRSQT